MHRISEAQAELIYLKSEKLRMYGQSGLFRQLKISLIFSIFFIKILKKSYICTI